MGEGAPAPLAGEDGFSLVELLVAIFVFGVVLAGFSGIFISAVQSVGDQRLRTAATRVAVDHIEKLRSLTSAALATSGGETTVTTPDGRSFAVRTEITPIDAASGQPAAAGNLKQVTVTVTWRSRASARSVSYSTAMAGQASATPEVRQAMGTVTMFPSPAVTDATGQPLEDIQVTVPLEGFAASTLVDLSWSNADGTTGAKTLTSTTGSNWRGTISRDQILGSLSANGTGEIQFTVSAGNIVALYTLALQRVVASPPAIVSATIDRNPLTVARVSRGRSCNDRNQCQNTTDVVFSASVNGLDPAQDSVIVQYQLNDLTFQEVPLTPVGGEWRLTVRQKTTKFLPGTARVFRLSAVRSADGATATATVTRDVVSV